MQQPTRLISTPFAQEGEKTEIQNVTGEFDNSATYRLGFPPLTMQSIRLGGKPPKGTDFNGVLFDITENISFLCKGGRYQYNAGLSTLIGGYPEGSNLLLDDNVTEVVSTVAGNQNNPNINMTGWILKPNKTTAVNVADASGETQQQVNYNGGSKWHSRVGGYLENERVVLTNGDIVKSTIDGNANDPNVDMIGWVKTNSASQVFDASGLSQQEINNLSGYDLKSVFWFMTPAEVASFKLAAPRTFDFTEIINRTLASFNSVTGNGTKQVLYLPAIVGGYRTTDTIWIPKQTGIIGDSGGLWQYSSPLTKPHSDFYADFSDPYKFVISSDTRTTSTNSRIPYDQLIEGNTMDGGNYTWSDGIYLSGFRINTASRVFGGVKLIGAVKSFIDKSVTVTGCDYGYVTSACWDSVHNGSSLSYKCGYLGYDALNGTEVNGYHNNSGAPTLSTTNLLSFFETGYKLPTTILNTYTTTFGVVLRKSFGVCGAKLIAESSDFPVLLYDRCQASYNSVYAERVGQCALLAGNQCQLDIGSAVGGLVNGAAIHLGTHAKVNIENYYMIQDSGSHIYQAGDWGDTAIARLPSRYFPNYHPQIIWNDKLDNVIYISSDGLDSGNGASYYQPTNLNQAFIRISNEREKYDKTLNMPINVPRTIYCINSGQYNLTQKGCVLAGDIRIRRKSLLSTSGVVLNLNELTYLSNTNLTITGVTVNIADKNYDFLSWARNAPLISQAGFNNVVFNACVTNFLGTTQAAASFDQNSDSILSINFKSGSIVGAGDLVQRAETVSVGTIANVYVGSSCAVDAAIKAKANFGVNLGKEQQGTIVLPWRLRYASATYDPTPLAPGAIQSTTVALTGATIGDAVACTFSLPLGGTRMWAEVTSANTVTVYHQNPTTVVVDVSSGTLTVKLI